MKIHLRLFLLYVTSKSSTVTLVNLSGSSIGVVIRAVVGVVPFVGFTLLFFLVVVVVTFFVVVVVAVVGFSLIRNDVLLVELILPSLTVA